MINIHRFWFLVYSGLAQACPELYVTVNFQGNFNASYRITIMIFTWHCT